MSIVEVALLGQVLLWLIVLGVFLASGQASLFHPLTVYLAFHGLVFVVRPIMVHYLNFDAIWTYMRFVPADADFVRTLAVTSVALLAFSIPCLWAGWSKLNFITVRTEPFSRAQWQGLIITTILLLPLIAYSMHSYLSGGMKG